MSLMKLLLPNRTWFSPFRRTTAFAIFYIRPITLRNLVFTNSLNTHQTYHFLYCEFTCHYSSAIQKNEAVISISPNKPKKIKQQSKFGINSFDKKAKKIKTSSQTKPLERTSHLKNTRSLQDTEDLKQRNPEQSLSSAQKTDEKSETEAGAQGTPSPKDDKKFRIYGLRAALAVIEKRKESIQKAWIQTSLVKTEPKIKKLMYYLAQQKKAYHLVEGSDELRAVSGSVHHEGIVLQIEPFQLLTVTDALEKILHECEMKGENMAMTVIFLENVGNPHNLGNITRTAAFFGIPYLFVSTFDTASLLHNKNVAQNVPRKKVLNPSMIRIAAGGVLHVNIIQVETYKELNSIFSKLKAKGFQVIATSPTEPTRMSIFDNDAQTKLKHKKNVLIFGSENTGVSRRLLRRADIIVGLPPLGAVDTLNVGNAVSAFLTAIYILQNSQVESASNPLKEKRIIEQKLPPIESDGNPSLKSHNEHVATEKQEFEEISRHLGSEGPTKCVSAQETPKKKKDKLQFTSATSASLTKK
jgi:TrmH RNA methyltransferase